MKIYQDGAQFYADATGQQLFESLVRVPDGNVEAACAARLHFEYWAKEQGLTIEFVGP